MNDLRKIFDENHDNVIHKWDHYFEIYHKWFNKYRDQPVTILEIGVYQGGSLKMWRKYFGKYARIFAIDINPKCKQFEEENIQIFIGSQSDAKFLEEVKSQLPQLDILIDDGGHTMEQQIITFDLLYDKVKANGLYVCEDLHTSYWANYGGGYKRKNTFIEYSKNLIDSLNAWHSREKFFEKNFFTNSAFGLHFYPSILIIEKKRLEKPKSVKTGFYIIKDKDFPVPNIQQKFFQRIYLKIKTLLYSFRK